MIYFQFRSLCTVTPHSQPFENYIESPLTNSNCLHRLGGDHNYSLLYMFETMLSRGTPVKDYLLINEKSRDDFVELVAKHYRKDSVVCLLYKYNSFKVSFNSF